MLISIVTGSLVASVWSSVECWKELVICFHASYHQMACLHWRYMLEYSYFILASNGKSLKEQPSTLGQFTLNVMQALTLQQ